MTPAEAYRAACEAGDTAKHVAGLAAWELRMLHSKAEALMKDSPAKGGVPAIIKWACVLEAAKRFLTK